MTERISAAMLRKLLDYEPRTGKLFWKERGLELFKDEPCQKRWNTRYAGTEAFVNMTGTGYHCGSAMRRKYLAHRVVWAIYYGQWPTNHLDHINGNPLDNRIANLRISSPFLNMTNLRVAQNNSSGFTGVTSMPHGKWCSSITVKRKKYYLGTFSDFEDAVAARAEAERKYGFLPDARLARAEDT